MASINGNSYNYSEKNYFGHLEKNKRSLESYWTSLLAIIITIIITTTIIMIIIIIIIIIVIVIIFFRKCWKEIPRIVGLWSNIWRLENKVHSSGVKRDSSNGPSMDLPEVKKKKRYGKKRIQSARNNNDWYIFTIVIFIICYFLVSLTRYSKIIYS